MNAIGRLALAPLTVALLLAAPSPSRASSGDMRTGTYYLELEGSAVGALRNASGGDPHAEEITERGTYNKHIGMVTYTPIQLEIGAGMDPAVYTWLAAACDFKQQTTSGAVILAGYDFNVIARREFRDALVAEVALPALDTASKDAAAFTVKLRPGLVRYSKGGGTVSSSLATQQRPWQASNFRLEIPGLDCSRVTRIEPIRWTTAVTQDAIGQERDTPLVKGTTTLSDIVITLPESSMDTWRDWAQQFIVQGNSSDTQEKNGDLVLLGSDLQSEMARVHLSGLGITGVQSIAADTAGGIRSAKVTLYAERGSLEWKGGTGAVMNVRVFGK